MAKLWQKMFIYCSTGPSCFAVLNYRSSYVTVPQAKAIFSLNKKSRNDYFVFWVFFWSESFVTWNSADSLTFLKNCKTYILFFLQFTFCSHYHQLIQVPNVTNSEKMTFLIISLYFVLSKKVYCKFLLTVRYSAGIDHIINEQMTWPENQKWTNHFCFLCI